VSEASTQPTKLLWATKDFVFYKTCEVTVKKVENKIVYYRETVECQHLIFWAGSQRGRVQCHTAKSEPNWNDQVMFDSYQMYYKSIYQSAVLSDATCLDILGRATGE
jgi:uncharacterized membrane protein